MPFLLKSHFFSSLPLRLGCFVAFAPCKTTFNASQGMVAGFRRVGSDSPRTSPIVPPEVAAQAARKRVEGIEVALGALAAVGTVDGPEVQMLKDCPLPRPSVQLRSVRSPNRSATRSFIWRGPRSD